ncbi:hypothetical protein MCOR25_003689 [Pyricularia grisea]|nr:hypothetical protein MCOR25_003689 [Pyricularia grisea]
MWNRRKQERDDSENAPPNTKSDASSGVREQGSGSLDLLAQKTRVRFANLATKTHEQSKSAADEMVDGAMDMQIGEKQLPSDAWRLDHEPKTPATKPPPPRIILKVGGVKRQRETEESPIVVEPETGDVVASEDDIAEQQMLLDMHKNRHEESKKSPQTSVQPDTKENNIPTENDDGWPLIRCRTGHKEEAYSSGSNSPLGSVNFRANSASTESSIDSCVGTPRVRALLMPDLETKIQETSSVETDSPSTNQVKGQINSSQGWFWTPEKWLSGQSIPEGVHDPISEGFADEWTPIGAPASDARAAVLIAKAAWSTHMAGKAKQIPDREKGSAEQAEVIHREHRKSQTEFMLSPAACLTEEEYCKIWAEWARLTRIKLSRATHGRRLPEDEGLCEGMLEAFLEMMKRASVGASVSHGEALKKEYHRFNAAIVSTMNNDQVMQDSSVSTFGELDDIDSDDLFTYRHHRVHQLKAEHDPPPRAQLVKKSVERGSLQKLDRKNREYYTTLMGLVQEERTAQVHPQANRDTDGTDRATSSGLSETGNEKQCEAPTPNQPAVGLDRPSLGVPVNVSLAQARAIEFFRLQMEEQEDKEGWIKIQAGLIAMMQKSEETRRELEKSTKRLNEARAQFREHWGDEISTDKDPYQEGDGLERAGRRNDTTATTTGMWWDTNAARQKAQADLRYAREQLFDLL